MDLYLAMFASGFKESVDPSLINGIPMEEYRESPGTLYQEIAFARPVRVVQTIQRANFDYQLAHLPVLVQILGKVSLNIYCTRRK